MSRIAEMKILTVSADFGTAFFGIRVGGRVPGRGEGERSVMARNCQVAGTSILKTRGKFLILNKVANLGIKGKEFQSLLDKCSTCRVFPIHYYLSTEVTNTVYSRHM